MGISRNVTVKVDITPQELATEFSRMGDHEQVQFLNELALLTSKWTVPFCVQLQYITDSDELTRGARHLMQSIGEYAWRPL